MYKANYKTTHKYIIKISKLIMILWTKSELCILYKKNIV